jgi:hypothetical protein
MNNLMTQLHTKYLISLEPNAQNAKVNPKLYFKITCHVKTNFPVGHWAWGWTSQFCFD